ncbi:Uncharacterised protein g1041 [Pycnogonum litorale]
MKIGPTIGKVLQSSGFSSSDIFTKEMKLPTGDKCVLIEKIGKDKRTSSHQFIITLLQYSKVVYRDECIPVDKTVSLGDSMLLSYV